ncbi:hypothetical protein AMAG_10335 [Allomyces macrogynus ATCC 38327]|uniref:Ubiquitin carboxyl-terminal hydrolase n=1 Tax=Allomyces macrogynus (strain ATCC 38327) TaxID=578462 RepID=A0A0L0SU79_ALLM3|nr:hypothetical protein AMAG_10335 [Allomyces macrogynus ATCC 38327]|eukprot:KNE66072.1 hypothetical protein AMAG_10335 [Allomyces macrogynus ATCC 38327]
MPCPHVASVVRVPARGAAVYKDECSQCFHDWDQPEGVDVCLTCFNAACPSVHGIAHAFQRGHPVAVNLRRVPKPQLQRPEGEPPAKITKLAIAAESDAEKYSIVPSIKCYDCSETDVPAAGQADAAIKAILDASTTAVQNEIKAWELEITPCEHTLCLEQGPAKQLDASLAHCGACSLNENLWLCLTCGHLGCGRAQYGGLSGNGHGLAHATTSAHPVAVKLGTITPEGSADVYCYACNDERTDPHLATHLAQFGINVLTQTKTEKSLVEMQIEQNLKFEFEMTSADGQSLHPVAGPGLVGLKNLGNSCYVAAVVQCLAHQPEWAFRYRADMGAAADHVEQCSAQHAECWECQWSKLVTAITQGQPHAVAPAQFKHLIAQGHADFATMKQQDASEFLVHVLKKVQQAEKKTGKDPSAVFHFVQAQKLECTHCHGVRYAETDANVLNVMVPDEALKRALKAGENDPPVTVDALQCLRDGMRELVPFQCPRCRANVEAIKTIGFKTFPKVLALTAQRFTYDNWVPKKSNVHLTWPAADALSNLDLSFLKVELLPTDHVLEDEPAAAASGAPAPDSEELQQLVSFGFPRGKAKRALAETGNHLEAAMNWIMDHPEDIPDEPEPTSGGATAVDESALSMLMDMGFTRAQAAHGLRETQGNVERAVEWLFSHPEAGAETESSSAAAPAVVRLDVADKSVYALDAFINHKGPSMHCGHYIAHVARREGEKLQVVVRDGEEVSAETQMRAETAPWVMLNDDRVVAQTNVHPLLEEAYVYLLRRKE